MSKRRKKPSARPGGGLPAALARLAQPSGVADPRGLGGSIAGPGGPRDQGMVVLDMTDAVLLESVTVATVDTVRGGAMGEQAMFMTLGGRVNKTTRQVTVGFVFGPDGAAGVVTELLAMADRFGVELLDDMTRRLTTLHQEGNVDLRMLKVAIDVALEAQADLDADALLAGLEPDAG